MTKFCHFGHLAPGKGGGGSSRLFGSKQIISKIFVEKYSEFVSFKNQLRILKMTCCKTLSEPTFGLQPALVMSAQLRWADYWNGYGAAAAAGSGAILGGAFFGAFPLITFLFFDHIDSNLDGGSHS